jgi:hypothetical protein
MIRIVHDIEAGKLIFDGELISDIYNKVLNDLSRTSKVNQKPNAIDELAVKKMRELVLKFINSSNNVLKANFQTFLKSPAFTDAEIDAHLLSIAKDPNPSHRWTATYLVQSRNLTSETALAAMELLTQEADVEVAKKAQVQIERLKKSLSSKATKVCKTSVAGKSKN